MDLITPVLLRGDASSGAPVRALPPPAVVCGRTLVLGALAAHNAGLGPLAPPPTRRAWEALPLGWRPPAAACITVARVAGCGAASPPPQAACDAALQAHFAAAAPVWACVGDLLQVPVVGSPGAPPQAVWYAVAALEPALPPGVWAMVDMSVYSRNRCAARPQQERRVTATGAPQDRSRFAA